MPRKPLKYTEGACVFCGLEEDNADKLGQKVERCGIVAHYFCMLFSSGLCQQGKEKDGLLGFLPKDIKLELGRGRRLKCSFCQVSGATIGCVSDKCKKVFHFYCGLQNGVLNQFYDTYRSYCKDHRPRQATSAKGRLSFHGTATTMCAICMSAVESRTSLNVLRTPCCKNAYLHRECVQQYASSAGVHFTKCPLCNDSELFCQEMLEFGIYIPEQDASWETVPGAFSEQLQRPTSCVSAECTCPRGRTYNLRDDVDWELMPCDWCGSQAIHLRCGKLESMLDEWLCDECTAFKLKDSARCSAKAPVENPSVVPPSIGSPLKRCAAPLCDDSCSSSPVFKRHLFAAEQQSSIMVTSRSMRMRMKESCNPRRMIPSGRRMSLRCGESSSSNASPTKLDSRPSVPAWLKALLNDDIHTGANLGRKFASQFEPCAAAPASSPAKRDVTSICNTSCATTASISSSCSASAVAAPSTATNSSSASIALSSSANVPTWLKTLMKDDIHTGANLGRKFASQFGAAASSNQQFSVSPQTSLAATDVVVQQHKSVVSDCDDISNDTDIYDVHQLMSAAATNSSSALQQRNEPCTQERVSVGDETLVEEEEDVAQVVSNKAIKAESIFDQVVNQMLYEREKASAAAAAAAASSSSENIDPVRKKKRKRSRTLSSSSLEPKQKARKVPLAVSGGEQLQKQKVKVAGSSPHNNSHKPACSAGQHLNWANHPIMKNRLNFAIFSKCK